MNKHTSWSLQDAKARFSELVRKAGEEGPQHVTVHGKEKVVVVAAEDFAKLSVQKSTTQTGGRLTAIMQDPRIKGLKFRRDSVYSPVRDAPDFSGDEFNVPARHKRS